MRENKQGWLEYFVTFFLLQQFKKKNVYSSLVCVALKLAAVDHECTSEISLLCQGKSRGLPPLLMLQIPLPLKYSDAAKQRAPFTRVLTQKHGRPHPSTAPI